MFNTRILFQLRDKGVQQHYLLQRMLQQELLSEKPLYCSALGVEHNVSIIKIKQKEQTFALF